MGLMHKPWLLSWGWALLMPVLAVGADAPATRRAIPAGEFMIVPEAQAQSSAFGMLMVCPAHAHGSLAEAEKKLKFLLEQKLDQPATIWVCRANPGETILRFGPLVDRIIVNPTVTGLSIAQTTGGPFWAGAKHPVLVGLCELRRTAGDRQLLACVDLNGEPTLFRGRKPTFDEIEWQVLAAVGGGYEGLVWRGDPDSAPSAGRLKQLCTNLRTQAADVAGARPVAWAQASGGDLFSAVCSESKLFLVVLSAEYLDVRGRRASESPVPLPLESPEHAGEILLAPPPEVEILSASTLSGKPVSLTRQGDRTSLQYRFRGGGDLIICTMEKRTRTRDSAAP